MRRLNVSLDTLDPAKYKAITRWGDHAQTMAGIDAAQAAGLSVKINMVALKGVNEDEIAPMLEWAHARGMRPHADRSHAARQRSRRDAPINFCP